MEKKLKYVDICEDLRGQILEAKIHPGDRLPSENELSAQYGVSRQTVRKALEILCRAWARHILFRADAPPQTFKKYCGCDNVSLGLYFSARDSGDRLGAHAERLQYFAEKYEKFAWHGGKMPRGTVAEGHRWTDH